MSDLHDDQPTESGTPDADLRTFRRALGQFATGVTVVTAEIGGKCVGVTANSFSSVSLEPPLVLWSLGHSSTNHETFERATQFAVNILSARQADIAAHFAKSGGDKFADVAWQPGHGGAPLLAGVSARFQCETEARHPGGDHTVIVGRVRKFELFNRAPLLFVQGRFGLSVDHPDAMPGNTSLAPGDREHTLLTLFRLAYLGRSAAFQDEAAAMGLTVMQSRLLYHLSSEQITAISELAANVMLDPREARDAADELIERGLLAQAGADRVKISPAGLELVERLRDIAESAEARKVAHLSPADVAAARRVLSAFAFGQGATG